ncbi:MAG: hypothetical protein HYY84_18655 [Deltaproteobacteria bacterium]|nr:hypothetical protein [Deltaproteobacteria bacterium]
MKWNRAGDKFVYAEAAKATKKQHFTDINLVPEQWVKVYSAAARASTTVLTLANFPEGTAFLRAEWSPDDLEVALLFYVPIGQATKNSFVATVPVSGGARAELKVDDSTGTATLKGKGRWNGGPTAALGWVKEELVDAIGWSRRGEFAYVRRAVPTRPRLYVVNAKGKEIAAEDGVTEVAWSPDGAELAVNRHGNVWVWNSGGGWRQVTAYPPKREPINEEDAVQNPQRIRDLAWSPDGKQVVFAVHQPGPGRRLALLDVKR